MSRNLVHGLERQVAACPRRTRRSTGHQQRRGKDDNLKTAHIDSLTIIRGACQASKGVGLHTILEPLPSLTVVRRLACLQAVRLAERVGFEPTVRVNVHTLSKRAP